MEIILLSVLAKVGLGFIVTATLVLLALHAFENQSRSAGESHPNRKQVGTTRFRLHHFPRVKHAPADREIEEPTQRAA